MNIDSWKPGTVLIIDDEVSVRAVLEGMFGLFGYKTLLASNGVEGVSIFEERNAEIDFVILDMIMPEMDGSETYICLREIDPNVKVIVASGFFLEVTTEGVFNKKNCVFVGKPFDTDELVIAVQKLLRK